MGEFNKQSLYSATVNMRGPTKLATMSNGANLDGMDVIVSPLYTIGADHPTLSAYAGETAMGLRRPVHESVTTLPSGDLANISELPPEAREQYPLMTESIAQQLGSWVPNATSDSPFANIPVPVVDRHAWDEDNSY